MNTGKPKNHLAGLDVGGLHDTQPMSRTYTLQTADPYLDGTVTASRGGPRLHDLRRRFDPARPDRVPTQRGRGGVGTVRGLGAGRGGLGTRGRVGCNGNARGTVAAVSVTVVYWPDCGQGSFERNGVAASALWATHYAAAHAMVERDTEYA